jgi:predicted permease
VWQLLTESVCLSVLGGAAGVVMAFAGVRALVALAPDGRIPRLGEVHVDGGALAFALAVSVGIGILAGLVPAFSSVRSDLQEALRERGRTAGRSHRRVRGRFVTAEIALAFVLLTGAGLMVKSFARMRSVDTGYDAAGVVTMAVDLPSRAYGDAGHVRGFHDELLGRLTAIPGVRAAGAVSYRPMGDMGIVGNFYVDGPTPLPSGYSVDKTTVSPGYFGAMGVHLIHGRDFSSHDAAGAPGAVVVSESVARAVWPGGDAVGKRVSMGGDPGAHDWLTVIGVVKDVVQDGELKTHSTIYLPYEQTPQLYFISHMTYVVRTAPGLAPPVAAIRAALHEMDPTVPAQALETMDASMLTVVAEPLFQTRLLTTFSLLALLLAAVGTYGVLAFDVAERTREIGIRMALGAQAARVVRMVMGRTLILAAAGVAIGMVGALFATRVLSRFLFEVSPTDPATFGMVAALLVGVACAAALVPAWRAADVDPVQSLKEE